MVDPRDTIKATFDARKQTFSCAIFSYVTTGEKEGGLLIRGIIDMVRERPPPVVERDYGELVFRSRVLEPEDGWKLFDYVSRNQVPDGAGFRLKGTTEFADEKPRPLNDSAYFGSPIRITAWPAFVPILKLRESSQIPNPPVVKLGLPPIADTYDAIDSWCGIDTRPINANQALALSLPDYRARITGAVFRDSEVEILVETGTAKRDALTLMGCARYSQKWQTLTAKADDGRFLLASSKIPDMLEAFLLDSKQGDVVDWTSLHPNHGPLPEGVLFAVPEKQILHTISEGENGQVEFKKLLEYPTAFIQSVTAFANSGGGKILVGVNDDGSIEGTDPEKVRPRLLEWIEKYCDPPVETDCRSVQVSGKTVLVVDVFESGNKPCVHGEKGVIYVRRGATDRPASRAEIDTFYAEKQNGNPLVNPLRFR